jgi:phosphatidylglycerophosphate synthase
MPEGVSDLPPTGSTPRHWLTWANGISAIRLVAAPLCALAVLEGTSGLAALLYGLAVMTDLVDGRIARRRGEVSALGGLLDHFSDAAFVSLVLGAHALRAELPTLLPVLVVLAFAQYVLDSRALAGRRLRTSSLGRWNGILYFVLAGTPIIRDILDFGWPSAAWVAVAGWCLVLSTALSMADRGRALLVR